MFKEIYSFVDIEEEEGLNLGAEDLEELDDKNKEDNEKSDDETFNTENEE